MLWSSHGLSPHSSDNQDTDGLLIGILKVNLSKVTIPIPTSLILQCGPKDMKKLAYIKYHVDEICLLSSKRSLSCLRLINISKTTLISLIIISLQYTLHKNDKLHTA